MPGHPGAAFLSHGGGPCFFMKEGFEGVNEGSAARKKYEALSQDWSTKPKAIVLVSAHWEEPKIMVNTQESPPLLYDYGGFPDYTYKLKYDAPGDTSIASRVLSLLESKGIAHGAETKRGWDHGVFIPLKLIYPKADVPIVAVSMDSSLSAESHLRLGEALRPLIDEGCMVIGSGQSTHNMRLMDRSAPAGTAPEPIQAFLKWLNETLTDPALDGPKRRERLLHWKAEAPFATEVGGVLVVCELCGGVCETLRERTPGRA